MRSIIKAFFLNVLNKNKRIKEFYTHSSFLRTPFGLTVLNFIVQRVFRINSEASMPVNFTSRVTAYNNIKHHKDKNTLLSFAVSGGVYIQGIGGIVIGRNVLFAPGVKIISANHDAYDRDKAKFDRSIKIGDNVWIGANAVLLQGVEIGNNCIIGAGSIVTKSFLENGVLIAGNPAKVIKKYLQMPPK